jgi:hypothetical protein
MILYDTKKKIEVRLCWKFACELRYTYIIYISKKDFFPAFIIVFRIIITESNVRSGFCTTELIL